MLLQYKIHITTTTVEKNNYNRMVHVTVIKMQLYI